MKVAAHHVESLDVFRGLTVAAMILVNNPGDWTAVFPPLLHAYWSGWTFADVVFPWFIFVMGAAMPFAFSRRRGGGVVLPRMYRRIVRRVALLIALGLALNVIAAWPEVAPLRFPGVLQRIALAYLIAAPIVLHFDAAGWAVAAAALLGAHWALLALVPFDGYAAGTLLPDHNLPRYVDTLIFGSHALMSPTDPEGLLGTLTAAATALCGSLAGEALRRPPGGVRGAGRLALGGFAALVAGLGWSTLLPISKPLWTGPFVLVTSGLAAIALACTFLIVDVRHSRRWAQPFVWLGVNPLLIYFLSEFVGHLQTAPKAWIYWTILEPNMTAAPELASLLFGIAFVAVWIGFGAVLYRRQIRVQV
jgi:predicted acyltransferase